VERSYPHPLGGGGIAEDDPFTGADLSLDPRKNGFVHPGAREDIPVLHLGEGAPGHATIPRILSSFGGRQAIVRARRSPEGLAFCGTGAPIHLAVPPTSSCQDMGEGLPLLFMP